MRFAPDLHGARDRLRRGALWAALGWGALNGGLATARELPAAPGFEDPGAPPFEVVVGASPAEIRADGVPFHIAGALHPGARVWISDCDPDCVRPGSLLTLEGGGRVLRGAVTPAGFEAATGGSAGTGAPEVATSNVSHADPAIRGGSESATSDAADADTAPSTWARVVAPDVEVVASPSPDAEVLRSTEEGSSLALIGAPSLERSGWRARWAGGVVPSQGVQDYVPADFSGAREPTGPQAFVLAPTVLVQPRGEGAIPDLTLVPAFGHVGVVGDTEDAQLQVEGGTLPREEIRLATRRARPPAIPAGARWVHVDREENVLTAYEGDRWVYAALVSVGTPGTVKASDPGIFRVYAKHRHADMKWVGEYDVEAVPDVLFYNRGEALHGAFWHDDFGHAVSYGCINLSLDDARWLFAWAPPDLPETWTVRNPAPGEDSLWVWVE